MMRTACHQLRNWIDQGLPPIRLSINVSRRQLVGGELSALVREVLDETGLDGGVLELELSEHDRRRARR